MYPSYHKEMLYIKACDIFFLFKQKTDKSLVVMRAQQRDNTRHPGFRALIFK